MKYTVRAMLALALLVGVYLLGVGVVGLLAFAVYQAAVHGVNGYLFGKIGIVAVIVALAIGRGLFSGLRRPEAPHLGIELSPGTHPRLWSEVRALAQEVGTRAPDELRLTAEVNAAVSEDRRWLGLRSGTRRLYVGAPLLVTFTELQLRAVLAHELGHYSGRHTVLSPLVYQGREAIARVVDRLGPRSLTGKVFGLYGRMYVAVSHTVNRRQELEADRCSVRVAGRAATAAMLRELAVVDAAWEFFLRVYVPLGQASHLRPVEVIDGFQRMWCHPDRRLEFDEIRQSPPQVPRSVYDTHPSIQDRVRLIEEAPDDGRLDDSGPALGLLDEPARTLQALEEWMFEGSSWTPVPWERLAADTAMARARSTAAYLADAAERSGAVRSATLGAVLDVVAEDAGAQIAADLVAEPDPDDPEAAIRLMVHLLALTVENALVARGRAHYRLSWSATVELVDGDGSVLDVWPMVAKAMTDPEALARLRDWADGEGLLDLRPVDDRAEPVVVEAQEPIVHGVLLASLSPVRSRLLLTLDSGVVIKKLTWREGWTLGLQQYGVDPTRVLLRVARRPAAEILSDRRSTVIPWDDITTLVTARSRFGSRRYKILSQGSWTELKQQDQAGEVGAPLAAMAHYLGDRLVFD